MYTTLKLVARWIPRSLLAILAGGVVVILGWLFMPILGVGSNPAASVVSVQLVSTAVPSQRTIQPMATLAGAWVAREEVAIAAPLEGFRVAEVLVESGDQVARGQVLARLEHTLLVNQVRQAEQAVKRTHAEFSHANEQYQRAQRLLPTGAVSRQDYEAVRATFLVAQAAMQHAEAARDEQRTRRNHADIRAPFAGSITERGIQVGAMVGAQVVLFRLASDQAPEFLAHIPQQVFPDLAVGMLTQINTSGREVPLNGEVRLISAGVDRSTGYGQARIALSGALPAFVRPGTVGAARIVLATRDVLAVDSRAVRFGPAPYVFVVDAGHARRTPIQIGQRQDGWVEVLSGLDTSSRVVVAGANLLQDGDPVKAKDIDALVEATKVDDSSPPRRLFGCCPWQRKPLLIYVAPSAKT